MVLWYQPDNIDWSLAEVVSGGSAPAKVLDSIDALIYHTLKQAEGLTHIVVMSNGGFSGFHGKLVKALEARAGGGDSSAFKGEPNANV